MGKVVHKFDIGDQVYVVMEKALCGPVEICGVYLGLGGRVGKACNPDVPGHTHVTYKVRSSGRLNDLRTITVPELEECKVFRTLDEAVEAFRAQVCSELVSKVG